MIGTSERNNHFRVLHRNIYINVVFTLNQSAKAGFG